MSHFDGIENIRYILVMSTAFADVLCPPCIFWMLNHAKANIEVIFVKRNATTDLMKSNMRKIYCANENRKKRKYSAILMIMHSGQIE